VTLFTAGIVACSGTSSTTQPPTTGILIRAETVSAGHGCGKGGAQLFKYAVVVFQYGEPNGAPAGDPRERTSYRAPLTGNVFDCYTDAQFIQLRPSSGNTSFRLEVFAFNEPAYAASRAAIDGVSTNPASDLRSTSPTWTTECTATQQQNVLSLANCEPLKSGLAGLGGAAGGAKISLATARFNLADGRVATCATAPSEDAGTGLDDAGLDADIADGASDAGNDANGPLVDAGPSVLFTTVRVRPRLEETVVGAPTDVPCPNAYVLDVGPDPAQYELDVALLDANGQLVGPGAETVCKVTSQSGTTSSAVCP
jgi:hypothetical protein